MLRRVIGLGLGIATMTLLVLSQIRSALRFGASHHPERLVERAQPESAEDEGVWIELDPSSMVLDVLPV